jgi:hypothetical protein
MTKRPQNVPLAILVMGLAAITCTVPLAAKAPVLTNEEIVNAAAVKVLTAQAAVTPSPTTAGTAIPSAIAVPIATQCFPFVTATTNANIRSGPGTAYDILGYLPTGGTAPIAGRSDTDSWWYIQFAGGPGGYGWIAGSVVAPSCLPSVVQVVAAPPLPTAPPTATVVISIAPWLQLHRYESPTPVFMFQQLQRYVSPTPP